MKFEEKRGMKKGEVADMFKGLGEMIEKDELRIGGENLSVPDDAEVEVEYKEKEGRAKLEVEVKWRVKETGNVKDKRNPALTVSKVKKGIKKSFNAIRSALESGVLPSQKDAEELERLNNIFNDLAKGREYEGSMAHYMGLSDRLLEAVKEGRVEDAANAVEEMRAAKKNCHKSYRWKE